MAEYFGEVRRVATNLRERVFSNILTTDTLSPDHWSVVNHCIQIVSIAGSCSLQVDGQVTELTVEISDNWSVLSSPPASPNESKYNSIFIECLYHDVPKFRQLYRTFASSAKADDKMKAVLDKTSASLTSMSKAVCSFLLDVLSKSAFTQLKSLVSNTDDHSTQIHGSVSSETLPDYSYAPRHQIAELGQYLLTLPHHLDTFGTGKEKSIAEALRISALSALVVEKQSAITRLSCSSDDASVSTSELLLEPICHMITSEMLKLLESGDFHCSNMSSAKQLATDVDYLLGVLDDLGQMTASGDKLKSLSEVLRSGSVSDKSLGADVVKLAEKLLKF